MTDLVERLRWLGDHASFEPSAFHEAADEIDRLRKRLEVDHVWRLKDGELVRETANLPEHLDGIACRDETIKLLSEDRKKWRAEIERLRAALQSVLEWTEWLEGKDEDGLPLSLKSIVRAALEGKHDPD